MAQIATSLIDSPRPAPRMPSPESVGALARTHYENFSVLSPLVPKRLRPGFAAIYAFCRVSDDLADEGGSGPEAREAALANLASWRRQLHACFHPSPSSCAAPNDGPDSAPEHEHPVFQALRPIIAEYRLPREPFDHLLDAFEQDQRIDTYETWQQLMGYCAKSAAPVGRLVLMLAGYRPPEEHAENTVRYRLSDGVCVALQLTNFWQDVRRDLIERDRVYLPRDVCNLPRERLREWLDAGAGTPPRTEFAAALRPCVSRTRDLFDRGRALPGMLDRSIAPVVGLFQAGGESVLGAIERRGLDTLWCRPRLSRSRKAWLVARAWLGTFVPRGGAA